MYDAVHIPLYKIVIQSKSPKAHVKKVKVRNIVSFMLKNFKKMRSMMNKRDLVGVEVREVCEESLFNILG